MKKILVFLLALMTVLCFGAAQAEAVEPQPVYLDYTTIIDGGLIYYSGSIDGGESGVFVMNADGTDARMIYSGTADLLALSGSNLMIYQYDMETGDSSLALLMPDGMLIPLTESYSGTVIAADRRFYWGVGSCAEDGTDVQYYFGADEESAYNYYPMAVHEGYYYYLDWSEMSGSVYAEGTSQPMGAALCRMNLADQTVEPLSGLGTNFLGIDNGVLYYTRNNYWVATGDGGEVEVDEGLFCMPLDTLIETRLAAYPENENAVSSYSFVEDGVVYGMYSDFSTDTDGVYEIIRVQADGTALPSFPIDPNAWMSISCVENGVLYGAQSVISASEDDFIQQDSVVAINLEDGTFSQITDDALDMLFYSEADPAVAAAEGRIFFSTYDMERWAVSLKSMNPDGSDLKLLAYGVSYAEG